MKTLKRNKVKFYYALYLGKEELIDGQGDHTFENVPRYGEWTEFHASISPARGESSAELFGTDVRYDKTIITDDLSCPIDENTVLAIDFEPGDEFRYDYIVTKVAKSLNFIQYAVAKVKVNA